jgi:replicative DNA helicase
VRTLPSNLEAEETIAGCLLLEPTAMETLNEVGLTSEAFYLRKTRIIFEAAQWLHSRQQHCDLLTISSRLSDTGQLEAIGGLEYLALCAEGTVSAVNLDRYADLVLRKWKRRELIKALDKALEDAYDPVVEDEEVWNNLETFVTETVTGRKNKGLKHISDILPEIWQDLESGKEPGISLGLNYLDQCLGGGLLPGELYVIAGRPGMGKTTVGQFVARAIARYQMPVAFFSAEMEEKQVVLRMLATEAQINHTALIANRFPNESAQALTDAYVELADLPLYFDDTPGDQITMRHIGAQCTRIYRKHGSLGLIILDYLQLIGDQAAGNRVNEIGKYTAQLKSFAKQFHCPVIALSQLSRGVESRNDKRPVMSDLRDSGCVEQDAGVILFLYRDEYYHPDTPDQGILEILIRKNRHGPTGTAKTLFTPETGKIANFKTY